MRLPFLYCIVYLLSISRASLLAQQIESKMTIVTYAGDIPYILYYTDDFLDQHTLYFENKNDNGNKKHKSIKLNIDSPILARFTGTNDQLVALIHPGDSIEIKPEVSKFIGHRNDELNFFNLLERKGFSMAYPDFWDIEWTNKLNVDMLLQEFGRYKMERSKLLDSLVTRGNISEGFYSYAKTEINSAYINSLLLPFVKDHKGLYSHTLLPEWYVDTLQSQIESFKKNSLLGSSSIYYRYCLFNYVSAIDKIKNIKKENIVEFICKEKFFNEEHYSYISFFFLKDQIVSSRISRSDFAKRIDEFVLNKKYNNYLHKYLLDINKKKNLFLDNKSISSTILESLEGNKVSWNTVLSRYKGKLIYLDIWASWCAPCRKEMSSSIELLSKMKDKDVAFIYLSVDDEKSKWLSAIKKDKTQLNNTHHYRVKSTSSLAHALTREGIPRYIVIQDKRVIVLNAPNPSEPSTKNFLYELIEK